MRIGAVILAAGAGRRMGGVAKALLRRGDRTFLQCIVETAQAAETIVVVGPPFGDEVARHASALGLRPGSARTGFVRVIHNPEPGRGMASSVALGFAALGDVDAAWLWPVDHPDVQAATLERLRASLGTHAVAQPRHAGRGGHPPLIARALFPRLAGCSALPEGARSVLSTADVIAVPVDDAGTIEDVDR